jgi:hypothetical protein
MRNWFSVLDCTLKFSFSPNFKVGQKRPETTEELLIRSPYFLSMLRICTPDDRSGFMWVFVLQKVQKFCVFCISNPDAVHLRKQENWKSSIAILMANPNYVYY